MAREGGSHVTHELSATVTEKPAGCGVLCFHLNQYEIAAYLITTIQLAVLDEWMRTLPYNRLVFGRQIAT